MSNYYSFNYGADNIYIDGTCDNLIKGNEGSGSIFAFGMMSIHGKVDNIGSGEVEVSCESNLDARIEGSGNVYYQGNPTINVHVEESGSLINDN